jgi:hypothetical protein
VLLSNPAVVRFIEENFVPCWQSVRPVPQVTIDFGNGRKLKRTLGGNTVIEVCLPDGRVVDAFPGLYTPEDFLAEARQTLELVRALDPAAPEPARWSAVLAWHRARAVERPRSLVALSLEKSMVESPLLRALRAHPGSSPPTDLLTRELGRLRLEVEEGEEPKAALARLGERLEDLSKQPATAEQLRRRFIALPEGQRPTPEQLGEMALRVDSRTNVEWARPAVHFLFAARDRLPQGQECRDAVFRQILHLPVDDPYLGLADVLAPGTPAGIRAPHPELDKG